MSLLSRLTKPYIPLNTIEISAEAFQKNYSFLTKSSGLAIAPVLKSNAYGHGLVQVGKILDKKKAPFFCVDSIYEGYELLKNGIKTPILIMGYVDPENLKGKKVPFSYAVYDNELVKTINEYQPHAGIHIFVDTGMHREGVSIEELPKFLQYVKSFENLNIEGLMSHFGESEIVNSTFTKNQLKQFARAQELFTKEGIEPKWIHIANSSGALHAKEYEEQIGNMARVGLAAYGIDPENKTKTLQPALQFVTTLVQIKSIEKGERVGYNFTYTADKQMMIGVLPVGYFDGVDRRLSNKGFVVLNDTICPIIGRVSMNITTIDISKVKNPKVGQSVVVYSDKTNDKNAIINAATFAGTIPYDLLVRLSCTTKRVVI